MKILTKWYKWILLAVIFQFCILLYVNNVFLNSDVSVDITNSRTKPESGDFKVPGEVKKVKVSFNGLYGAYTDSEGVLHVINIDTHKGKEIAGEDDKITFFKWLPDRNMVIYSSDTKGGKKGIVQITTYEADSETTREIPQVSDLTAESKVTDIDLSPFTNVVYASIKTSATRTKIIRFNVMNQYAHVMNLGKDAIIKECNFVNKLVYQNPGESVYIYDGISKNRSKLIIDEKKVRLLDIDGNDTLYLGVMDSSGKISKICSQKIADGEPASKWTKVNLRTSVLPEDLVISVNGNIYSVNKEDNNITNIKNNLKASYRGEFIEMLNGALVSKDGNKVNITSLKEY